MTDWYLDEEFTTPLPDPLPDAVARCYGTSEVAVDFAQSLAAFIAIDYGRSALVAALTCDGINVAIAEFFRSPDEIGSREHTEESGKAT